MTTTTTTTTTTTATTTATATGALATRGYLEQRAGWPESGRHILAQYDDESVVVYQAYRPAIGHFAARSQYFGGPFQLDRMSWIKPNFLWMMYRSGWASKPGQEVVLAVRIARHGFDRILAGAVHSTYVAEVYGSHDAWRGRLKASSVRLQWDPDHAPGGARVSRRAIQLGLRGDVLQRYAREWIRSITDITALVHDGRARVQRGDLPALETPRERVYPVADPAVAARLGVDAWPQ